jgi:hypothetical protein
VHDDLERRVDDLEQRFDRLERRVSEAQVSSDRRRSQEKWIRIGILVMVAAAYGLYLRQVLGIL